MTSPHLSDVSTHCILLDAGNTRVKWVVANRSGAVLLDESRQSFPTIELQKPEGFNTLVQQLVQAANQYACLDVWVCHVLGDSFFAQLDAAVFAVSAGLKLRAPVVGESAQLKTDYSDPSRLGQDRWIACLAVLGFTQSSLNGVVSFGTATTVDAVVRASARERSIHLGGVIYPGLDLMLDSLHRNTAQLPKAQMQYEKWPRSTDAAIASGVIRAQWSAVQGFVQDLEDQFKGQNSRPACLWVHGGHAETLIAHVPDALGPKLRRLQDAVFHGLMYSMSEALASSSKVVGS